YIFIRDRFREGGNNLSDYQESELAKLNKMAAVCGMSLDDFLSKLNEVGVAQSQAKKDFLEKIYFNGRSNADPVKQYLSGLADEEYTLLLDAEIPISSKTWLEKDWENFIEQLKFKTGELTIDFNPETAFNAMTTALSEQSEKGYLKDETMQSLKSAYGDLTEILTYSENGIVLNTEAMVDLTNQTAEAALVSTRMKEALAVKDYQKAARQLNNYKKEHVDLEDALNGSTGELNDFLSSLDEIERVDIQNTIDQMQTLSDTINEYDALEAKIRATTSALNDYVRATSTANNADNFDTARGGLENAKKMYENGWTGKDDYKTYIDYIGKYNEEMNNYQSPEDYFNRAKRYLTEDISGIYNFLDDAAKLDNGWVTNANGQYDIAINDLNKFAEDMDMSLSFVTDMLLATTEAWDFDVDFSSLSEGLIDGLNAIDLESENARTNLNEFKKTIEELDNAGYDTTDLWNQFHAVENEFNKDIQFTLSISDMSEDELLKEAENVADDIAKAIGVEEIKFDLDANSTDNLIKQVKDYRKGLKEGTDEYNKAQLVMAKLIQQKQKLENPSVMSVDTTGMSDEMSGAIALVQQWIDASNELERTQALGLDTTQAQAQLDSLTTKLSSVSSTTLANLGLNISGESSIEEIKSQISSIDVNALAKDTNVKITADPTKAEQSLNQFKSRVDNTIGTVKIEGQLTPDFVTDLQKAINNHTYNVKVNATVNGGNAKAEGSAHAKGSAFSKGKWTVGTSGKSLVGELGTEILVRNGEYRTIGDNGAEFIDVKDDDIIFNHKQTEQILKYGHINSRGQARVTGSAFSGTEKVTGSGGSGWKNNSTSASKSKSKNKDKKSSKTLIDWIERRFNVLIQKAERWSKLIENATNPKRLDSYYKKLEENYKKQLKSYSDGATRYLQKANSIKLSSDLKNKVKSKDSSIFNKDGSMKSYKSLIKEYGEKTAKKIQDYQNYIDKYESAIDSFIETTQKLYQSPIEKAADKIELLSKSLDLLDAKLDNISIDDYKKANDNLKEQTENAEAQLNANKEAEKLAKSNYNSAKSAVTKKSNLEANDLAGNKSKRNKSAKAIKDAITKGEEIDLTLYKEGSSGYKAAVKYNAALKAQKDATNAAALAQEEYTKTLRENVKAQFDNVEKYYESKIGLLDNQFTSLDNKISEIETAGKNVNKSYYQSQKKLNDDIKKSYEEEKAQLNLQLEQIKQGTEEWYDAKDAIQECDNKISDCVKTTYDLNNAINELHFSMFEDIADAIERIITEQEFLQGLFAHEKLTDDKTGDFTDAGLAKLGSLSASYYASKEKAEKDAKEVKELQRMLNAKSLHSDLLGITFNSVDDLEKKLDEMYTQWQNDIKETYSLESNIADLMKEKYQAELDLLQELIDKKKAALNFEKDLHSYQQSIQEKTKNITTIQKQIAAYSGNTSQEGMAKLQKLQKSLADEQSNLEEQIYDRYISDQQDMLDKLSEEYEELITKKLEDFMTLVKEGLEKAENNTSTISSFISDIAGNNGYVEQYRELFTMVSGSIEQSANKIIGDLSSAIKSNSGTEDATDSNSKNSGTVTINGKSHGTGYHSDLKVSISGETPTNNKLSDKLSDILSANKLSDTLESLLKLKTHELPKLNIATGIKKVVGFKKGGIAKLVKSKGEDGFTLARNGEGFIAPEHVEPIEELVDSVPQINNVIKTLDGAELIPVELDLFKNISTEALKSMTPDISSMIKPSLQNLQPVRNNMNNVVNIDNITLPNVTNAKQFVNELLPELQKNPKFEGIVKDMGINLINGGNNFTKY
ncbi:MAG: hypothetical protein K2I10_00570, partial [Lachnospiraceae bacterium]|nr:hypothetical protein [Lachnospiraceae bacterium]